MSLFEGELQDILNPVLMIDQYNGKVIDTSIVVVIKAKYRDPLLELESFIETGYIPIIDTEVSEYANEDEDFLLFIEFERHPLFTKRFLKLLEQLSPLCYIKDWKFTTLYNKEPISVTENTLKQYIPLMTVALKRQQLIKEFFNDSKCKPEFDYNYTILNIQNTKYYFNFVEQMDKSKVINYSNKYNIDNKFYESTVGKNIKKIFGNNFNIYKIGKLYIFKNNKNQFIAFTQKLNKTSNKE